VVSTELQDEVADFVDGKQTLLLAAVTVEILRPNVSHLFLPLLGGGKVIPKDMCRDISTPKVKGV